jgi:hypothetical protein
MVKTGFFGFFSKKGVFRVFHQKHVFGEKWFSIFSKKVRFLWTTFSEFPGKLCGILAGEPRKKRWKEKNT